MMPSQSNGRGEEDRMVASSFADFGIVNCDWLDGVRRNAAKPGAYPNAVPAKLKNPPIPHSIPYRQLSTTPFSNL